MFEIEGVEMDSAKKAELRNLLESGEQEKFVEMMIEELGKTLARALYKKYSRVFGELVLKDYAMELRMLVVDREKLNVMSCTTGDSALLLKLVSEGLRNEFGE